MEVDDGVRVSVHPPYKPTPNVEIEKDHPNKEQGASNTIKRLRRLNTPERIRRPQPIQYSPKALTRSSHISKKRMQQSQ